MPVDDKVPVLDVKPLQHNPFLDGTVVYDNAGGVLVPRSAGSMVDPLESNPLVDPRPSNASTQQRIDSAQKTTRGSHVVSNASAPRGYELQRDILDPNASFDPDRLSRNLDTLSEGDLNNFIDNNLSNSASRRAASGGFRVSQNTAGLYDTNSPFSVDQLSKELNNFSEKELNDFIDDTIAQSSRSAAEVAATGRRQLLNKALKRGSRAAGAIGLAMDAYNLADAVLDPTNNPLDEIGDFVGSTLGGALGAPFGPVGSLGGSILGGWLGGKLGNLLQGEGGRAEVSESGPSPFEGGQSPGVWYSFNTRPVFDGKPGQARPRTAIGPISKQLDSLANGGKRVSILDGNGNVVGFSPTQATAEVSDASRSVDIDVFNMRRSDGLPDTGGNPPGEPIPTTTAPDYPPISAPFPSPSLPSLPLPDVGPPSLPSAPFPDVGTPRLPGSPALDAPPGSPSLDAPPAPDNLPSPSPTGGGSDRSEPTVNPNPEPDCCEINGIKLDSLITAVQEVLSKFEVSGAGVMKLPDCGSEQPNDLAWEGMGLDGIYLALQQLSSATTRVWEQINCPPDSTVAIPEWWAVRPGSGVPQLAVTLGDESYKSKWSLTIPHYNKGQAFKPQLPAFRKGSYFTTLTLTDNTKVVINAASFDEGERVIRVLVPLIDSAYVPEPLDIHQGKRKGKPLVEVDVSPKSAAFYPNGQQDPIPAFYPDIEVV